MDSLVWALLIAAILCITTPSSAAEPGQTEAIALWPKDRLEAKGDEKVTVEPWRGKATIRKITNVWNPTITVHKPKAAEPPTPAVVVCPGGGYGILAHDLEGTEVAEWLNGIGVTGIVLKYRVPRQRDAAFQDAQRAVGLVRHRAKSLGIDPRRVGILGFSAGGHLAARLCTNFAKRAYEPVDDADAASCRPDFAVLIYPAYMAKDGGLDAATLPVAKDTPAAFIAIACNDKFTPGALAYFGALRQARVRSELHVFSVGGHGCGLRKIDDGLTTWPAHCERWLRSIRVLAP
jgi:acetyl esterase/lipase